MIRVTRGDTGSVDNGSYGYTITCEDIYIYIHICMNIIIFASIYHVQDFWV